MQIRYFVPSPIKVLKFDEEQLSVKGVSEISDHSVTVCVFFELLCDISNSARNREMTSTDYSLI